MKQLVIPEQHDIDIGPYGPACEGFIDTVKDLIFKNPIKDRVTNLKSDKFGYSKICDELDKDLQSTYDNPGWIKKNLPESSGVADISALKIANANQKQITTPAELVKVANGMLSVIKEIAQREKPFIDYRRKLYKEIEKIKDAATVDAIWLKNEKQLKQTGAERAYQKYKKPIPALGGPVNGWPFRSDGKNSHGFSELFYKTEGTFELPSAANAKNYANAIRALADIAEELDAIGMETRIPYWDGLAVEYDDLKYGDEIYSKITTGQSGDIEHLAFGASYTISRVIIGLYIAMFDKYAKVSPANEGLIGDAVNFIFPKKKKKAEEKPAQQSYDDFYKQREKLEQKLKEFLDNPSGFRLTGKAYSAGAYMHLSINGRSPVITHLPAELAKTFKAAETLANKFKKDMKQHAGIAIPLMGQFEKDMLAVMEKDGSVPQEALDKAMLPIIAAKSKLDSTYFNSFGKDQHIADHWVGGNPFKMISHKRNDGSIGWTDESYDIKQPHVAVDKVDKIETLSAMLNAILPYMEDSGLWVKSNGPFDTDSDDVKRPDYEFDRPVRHLSDYMSNEQTSAIYALYSFEENTQSLHYRLCDAIEKVLESVVVYISGSIEKIQ